MSSETSAPDRAAIFKPTGNSPWKRRQELLTLRPSRWIFQPSIRSASGIRPGACSSPIRRRWSLLHHGHVLKCGPLSWRTKNPDNLQQEQSLT
jgi:hypothetical protein